MKYLVVFIFSGILVLLQSCSPKCQIDCSSYPSVATVGYNDNEIDTIILRVFTQGTNFSAQIDSITLNRPWEHISIDTLTDTLTDEYGLLGEILSDLGNRQSKLNDFEIYIPSSNRVYQISNLTFNGPETNDVGCYHGDAVVGAQCNSRQYISSYVINGSYISFPPSTNFGYIYLVK